jgi:hypothetical protein
VVGTALPVSRPGEDIRAGILRRMDGVALASVITSGVLGITTSSIAVWSARHNANLARETRTQQRLADSYLEVLRIVEREGQWVEASITNLKLTVEEAQFLPPHPEPWDYVDGFKRVKVPEEPAITDRAIIAAHLATFGSPNVRRLYQAWRFTITEIDIEEDLVRDSFEVNPGEAPDLIVLKNLKVLQPKELAARQALADAIAEELGHR